MNIKLKKIDKLTLISMTILFIIAIAYMTVLSLSLMSITIPILEIAILIAMIIIPLICVFIFVFTMFIIRYIMSRQFKTKRMLRTIVIIVVTLVIIFSAHYFLLKYCLFGSYEIKIENKIESINNTDLKNIIESMLKKYDNYKKFEIDKVIIEPGFPDDYLVKIYYRDMNNKKTIERGGYLSDSEGYKILDNAEDLAKRYMSVDIALFILGTILLVITYIYLIKEYQELSKISIKKQLEGDLQVLEDKRRIAKTIILISIGVIIISILILIINNVMEKKVKNQIEVDNVINDDSDETINIGDSIYEKKINENISLRIVFQGAVIAQRSIISIEKTTDGGKTWINQLESHDRFIQIHNGAKFIFLDENIGFINDPGLAGTDGENRGLLVTRDGGKSIEDATIIHPSNITEKNLFISEVPYLEGRFLKVKIYTINYNKNPIKTYYEFISNDNGKTWIYHKEI